ncbi:MAG: aminotransferase class I/II-fold pyridoxal phosphate-dependent enzyme, partial [Proteobacteria bacterium]|nr:aminotransferase class I/II-fold pyridoxal phosphate-dependent enzyme [Pseudomonadota bacterium]
MINDAFGRLTEYPFDRLRALLNSIEPAAGIEPLIMSLGEPRHPSPKLLAEAVAAHADEWNLYPPTAGTPDHLAAIHEWLTRRYNLPAGMVDPSRNLIAVSGTREALFLAGSLIIPRSKFGKQPAVLMPSPFYQVYVGAAVFGSAEPIYMPATLENQFLPDFTALAPEQLERAALVFLCSPSNPQGTIADLEYLKSVIQLARIHDFVVVFDECYAEIYDRAPPPGGLEACAELGGSLNNVLV